MTWQDAHSPSKDQRLGVTPSGHQLFLPEIRDAAARANIAETNGDTATVRDALWSMDQLVVKAKRALAQDYNNEIPYIPVEAFLPHDDRQYKSHPLCQAMEVIYEAQAPYYPW